MAGRYTKIIRIFIPFILMIGIAGFSFAQESASGYLSVQAGITVFNDPSDGLSAYVQFPYSVGRNQFEFAHVAGSDKLKATIYAELILSDTLGNHLDSASTYYYSFAESRDETTSGEIKLVNVLSLMIEPGKYKALLTVIDVTSKNKGSFIYDRIEIDRPFANRLSLSNLELAYDIKIVDESLENSTSPLIKNGYKVIPSPMGLFSEADSNLFIYTELYNLDYDPDVSDSFTLAFSIYNTAGTLVQDYGVQTIKKPGTTSIITNGIDFSGWTTGRYKVKLMATDKTSGQTAQMSRQFVIFSKSEQLSDFVATTIISPLDTASLETKTNWIHFLVDPADWIMFKTLNKTGKAEFITQYFRDQDPTPGDKKNEYLEDILYRFNFANKHFSSLPEINDGWRSDRGRVLLQYGQSDKVDDEFLPSGSVPLQIWRYYFLEEGVYFVFQDLDEFGNYRLVHSNKQGERFDNDWEYWIKNNGMESETSAKRGTRKIPDEGF